MADDTLNPGLRQIAEQYLNRPLEANEEAQLLKLQQGFQGRAPSPAAGALDTVEQARQQAQRTIGQGQTQASSSMRGILESIQASSSKALQVQQREEQAILKLLESCKTLSDLRPASLNPGLSSLQAGNQLALTQIAEHLANLARQEVENCFNQHFGPLAAQLQALIQRLNEQDAAKSAEAAAGAGQDATPADDVHDQGGQASMQ
ncbi:hypothetical protein FAZ69_22255 [Trinickia terrae]|uniref:Uncharacterized protein n=1 Tax=Trinickia terrae TaxID=2571161 RepID=A0A4U1HWF8_9BURK|nr:hypothetical protein [Trinickia terrae]TKC86029.1 hypothetical protein FAZ69_22255 [Trinickia terrae]